ncbi:ABC transporter permease [Halosimplex aquaticum]|uniref:ABC transporter permease n=1 Tax=Halosimplex aquaticum TaxID=3026162 RepID=A0ABD5Y9V8_9EURY|nr:ABC transporter permease [Halosimplex aquaticum]
MSEKTPKSDGGVTQESIFGTDEEVERRRTPPAERARRAFDFYVATPFRVAWEDWRTRIGGMGILFYVLMGTVGVLLVPQPQINEGPYYLKPFVDWSMPLGTDSMGRGVFKTLVHSTPAMMQMALAGVVFSVGVAVLVGMIAGYKGGVVDTMLMTVADVFITLPGLPLIIVLASIFSPDDPFIVGTIIAIDQWPGLARMLRSQVLALRDEDFVEAARSIGLSTPTIVGQELVPKVAPFVLISAAGAAVAVIFQSVALYFIGVLPWSSFNWGVMMQQAYRQGNAIAAPGRAGHWMLFPLLAISGMSFSLILFSQGLDRVFNPRLLARHSETVPEDEQEDAGGL